MARIAIAQMRDGDTVEQAFVLASKQIGQTSNAKLFIKAECADATGQIHCRVWNATRDQYDRLPQAGFVRVRGRIETYQGHLQLVADAIGPCDESSGLDLSELIKHTRKNVPEMYGRMKAILGQIRDRQVRALIEEFLSDAELMKKFIIAPAAMGMHHAWIGGLLEHTTALLELAVLICPRYPDIDQDIVLAGLFLHDIAKTVELSYACGFDYTDQGRLIGHVVQGAIWIDQKSKLAEARLGEPLRGDLLMVLQHIVLSHHGTPEFGAAVCPKTPEAILINLIDNLDAKTQMAIDAVAAPAEDNTWTEFCKAFGTKLYRPSLTMRE
ncbi:MAG TPA: HD domain-containing protein [Phycisphaerae bacterium]|nr:HD domain-containing protein [Phycisphaerae bacterium]